MIIMYTDKTCTSTSDPSSTSKILRCIFRIISALVIGAGVCFICKKRLEQRRLEIELAEEIAESED